MKFAGPIEPHFEHVIPRGRRRRHEANNILHVQFGSELLDRILERLLLGERERCPSGAFRQYLCGVRLMETREFADAAKNINLLFRRRNLWVGIVRPWRIAVYSARLVVGPLRLERPPRVTDRNL